MTYERCESEICQTGKLPSQDVCEDFFEKFGRKQLFWRESLRGVNIHIDGQQHQCSTEKGPGEFGWCRVFI